MAFKEPRHKARFTATATVYTPSDNDQMEVKASLDKLRALLPPGINPDTMPTLLFAAGNLAVAELANLNDDAMTLEDTLATYRAFEWQQVNEEHERSEVRGFIVKAGLSEFGTDRLITEEEARAAGKPVNVAIVFALWRVVDRQLCDFVQRADAPGSPDKGKLSLSFEVGFDDYDIVVLPKGASNLALATMRITPDSPDWDHYDKMLRVNGGKGMVKDQRVARIIMGNIVPLGAGIVTTPAAAVKGLTAITEDPHAPETVANEADAGLYKYSSTQVTMSEADAVPFKAYAASIPDDHIHTDEKDPTLGRMTEDFHATVCYGLTTVDPAAVRACLASFGPITMTMGKVNAFSGEGRDYDVLYVEVDSPDLHRAHALIKTATEVKSKWPSFTSHLTIAYLRPGMARGYVGDTRFESKSFTFSSITFSPHEGDRVEIPLVAAVAPQTAISAVYSPEDPFAMASAPSTLLPLSAGWQAKLATIGGEVSVSPEGKVTYAGLPHGIDVVLSDGRVFKGLTVHSTEALQLPAAESLIGIVITSMTPGVPMQADDPRNENPRKADVYPTTSPEQQARDAEVTRKMEEGQRAGYTSATIKDITAAVERAIASHVRMGGSLSINTARASVSSSNPTSHPMKLEDLKQSIASVKTVEELPQVVANIALFAEEISKASEKIAQERQAAQDAATASKTSLDEVKAQLATLQTKHSEMVAAQTAAAAEVKFNERMAAVEDAFALDDDIRAEIVDEVKTCANDESFAKWMTKAKKTMKGWLKASKPCDDDDDADDKKAAKAAAEAIASAANNPVDKPIDPGFEANQSLAAAMQQTFAAGVSINGVKVKDITAKAKK